MASRAALLLCAAVCLFATAMAADELAQLAELNTPITDAIFHPETMVKIASDDKYGYYKRVHKKGSHKHGGEHKGEGEHKKAAEYKPKKEEYKPKKEEHKKEGKEYKKPEANEYPPEGEVYEKDGYELVDGYYYHGEPPKSKEYKDYEAEYPEYSNYPDKFLPKVCIQSLPTQPQQKQLLEFLNGTAGNSITITDWAFGCCCHGEDEGYAPSKEYKPTPGSYDSDYSDYLTNGYYSKTPSNPNNPCNPPEIGNCDLTFTITAGVCEHLSPTCDKLNITVTGQCEITKPEAKKCIPFGHYDDEEKVTFELSWGYLFKVAVGIPTPGAPGNYGYDDDYYSQYPYVLTNAASKISAQTAQSSKVSIASANGKHYKHEDYYGEDGESEYEPAPYPAGGIERGWAITLLAKIKDVEQCIHDHADCHDSKTVEGGMIELILATLDTNCLTTAGNPVGAGVAVIIPGTTCAGTNHPVPVAKWGAGKMKLRKRQHHDYGYGSYKEYKPTPSYKEGEHKKEEKKSYKKDEKKY